MALELLSDDQEITIPDTTLEGVTGADADVSYTVRPIPLQLNRQLRKKHTKTSRPNGIKEDTFDVDGFIDDLLDYALIGWAGITYKGEPAPCTRELKIGGLDTARKQALLVLAGINRPMQAKEQLATSFRRSA